jgi:hypothetical protein
LRSRAIAPSLLIAAIMLLPAACNQAPTYPAGWPLPELTLPAGVNNARLAQAGPGRWEVAYTKDGVPLAVVERIAGPLRDAGWSREQGQSPGYGEVLETWVSGDGSWRVVIKARMRPRSAVKRKRVQRSADYTYTISGPAT